MFHFLERAPLLVFIVVSLALFMADRVLNTKGKPMIELTDTVRQSVLNNERNLKGSALSINEQDQAVHDYIDEEVLLKEAYRLGLDNDPIIRTRLLRKLKFIYAAELIEPSDQVLQDYYQHHKQSYKKQDSFELEQIFFGIQITPPSKLVQNLNNGTEATHFGELHPRFKRHMVAITQQEVMARFGKNVGDALLESAAKNRVGKWRGPYKSPYGVHFIRVLSMKKGGIANYSDVKKYVSNAWKKAEKEKIVNMKVHALKSQYDIYIEEVE